MFTCVCILQDFKFAVQFVLKSEQSREPNATKMAEKERKNPVSRGGQSSSRRVVRYREEPERHDQAYQAMKVDLSTVRGAAVLMTAAALTIAGNPENQGIRLWGQLAFGELEEGEDLIEPVDGTIRDMLFIDGRLHGYDMAR